MWNLENLSAADCWFGGVKSVEFVNMEPEAGLIGEDCVSRRGRALTFESRMERGRGDCGGELFLCWEARKGEDDSGEG